MFISGVIRKITLRFPEWLTGCSMAFLTKYLITLWLQQDWIERSQECRLVVTWHHYLLIMPFTGDFSDWQVFDRYSLIIAGDFSDWQVFDRYSLIIAVNLCNQSIRELTENFRQFLNFLKILGNLLQNTAAWHILVCRWARTYEARVHQS